MGILAGIILVSTFSTSGFTPSPVKRRYRNVAWQGEAPSFRSLPERPAFRPADVRLLWPPSALARSFVSD